METKNNFPPTEEKTKEQKAEPDESSLVTPHKCQEEYNQLGDSKYTSRKKQRKIISVIFQVITLAFVAYGLASLFLTFKSYEPYSAHTTNLSKDNGFIALSYIGTQRTNTGSLFGRKLLRQHLTALKDMGYVTITQQDIIDYYQSGKPLPEKALFLMFEDARRNTVIFSQRIMEELNFKATMLTYPERFLLKDSRFLRPSEIADLIGTSFWEVGSNGYRYAFINVYDKYDNYFEVMDLFEHAKVAPYLQLHLPQRRQSHYLMDYIRDRYGIVRESHGQMQERISYDYKAMYDAYNERVGFFPQLHALLSPNTGKFGNHDDASAVNEYWIKNLFKINFNRAGSCVNKPSDDIYDLTRMQPQAWWSVNHLLIKLKHDLNQDLEFVSGDEESLANWHVLKGVAQFQGKTIILTSFPRDTALLSLKNSAEFKNVHVSVRLVGNKLGRQKIYLRADEGLNTFLAVAILDNFLYVTEKTGGEEKELFRLNLDRHDGKRPWSVPEDKKMAEINRLQSLMDNSSSRAERRKYEGLIKAKKMETVPTIADGAPEYVPIIRVDEQGDRKLLISLKGNFLSIRVGNKEAFRDLPVANIQAGLLFLESGWSGKLWADEVYDGVFEDLLITENTAIARKNEKILYDIRPQGWEAVKFEAREMFTKIVELFISKI